jgi:hypothetical protein
VKPSLDDLRRALKNRALTGLAALTRGFFDDQASFCASRALLQKVLGTRRSGKSTAFASKCLLAARLEGEVAYCHLTIDLGRAQIWPHFEKLDHVNKIGLKFDRANSRVTTPTGGIIKMYGLSTKAEAEKLRGGSRVMGVIDEAGAQSQLVLELAVKETLGPSCWDYAHRGGFGVVVGGTPSRMLDTYWHNLCKPGIAGADSAYWHFNIRKNPLFVGHVDRVIAAFCKEFGIEPGSAAYQREVEGKFCPDTEGLCYAWNGFVLPEAALPEAGQTLLSVDFGKNTTAYVVGRVKGGVLYILEARETHDNNIEAIVMSIRQLKERWGVGEMIGDSADGITLKSMHDQYGFPMRGAKKPGSKEDRIWTLDSGLRTGQVMLGPQTAPLQAQLRTVLWNEDRDDHHESQPDHSIDATHYLEELVASFNKPKAKAEKARYGSKEWFEAEEIRAERDLFRRAGLRPPR